MLLKSLRDPDLLTLLSQGNESAFKELYERYWYGIYSKALRKTGRKDISEEMAQHIFEILWQKRSYLKIDNVGAYLNTALKNLIIDYVRKNIQEQNYLRYLEQFVPFPTAGNLNSTVQYDELTTAIHQSLNMLPEKTRTVFVMSRFEQRSIPEISAALHLSEKAIEYHLSRALLFLRKNLREFIALWVLIQN